MAGVMKIEKLLKRHQLVLTEAAIIEPLRRSDGVHLHPLLENGPLIYDINGRQELSRLYNGYLDIARQADVPMLLFSPTWRTNHQRVTEAGFETDINADAVQFLMDIRKRRGSWSAMIGVGGLVGCKNDCYQPQQGLSVDAALAFHGWQVERLSQAGPDFLMAATLPALPEAIGIALAMAKAPQPYLISFVINRAGLLLDGTSLATAMNEIDAACHRPPLGYLCNCCYPSFLNAHQQPKGVMQRLLGYQANASSMDPWELDGSAHLHMDDLNDWGRQMVALHHEHHLKILGGCCGTGVAHLSYIVENADIKPWRR